MRNIILVGAGQIGSRHLQALALTSERYQITVVDPSQNSLDIAQSRLEEIPQQVVQVSFCTHLPTSKEYDLAIIATSAMHRFDVFQRLVEANKIGSIIFEKILFQTLSHIEQAEALLRQYGIKAWVNCARRSNPGYRKLQQTLQKSGPIKMVVNGQNYGLACNGIHFLDLFDFLVDQSKVEKFEHRLQREYVETKRQGCYEVFGCLTASAGANKLEINCSNEGESAQVQIEIISNDRCFVIDEVKQTMREFNPTCTLIEQTEFRLQPQSKMTHIVVNNIIDFGQCTLPTYAESAALHNHYLQAFDDYFNTISPGQFSACPIS